MKTLVALTILLKGRRNNKGKYFYKFHFKGVYNGEYIKRIDVESEKSFMLSEGSEYILYLRFEGVYKGVLQARFIKVKNCEKLYWK